MFDSNPNYSYLIIMPRLKKRYRHIYKIPGQIYLWLAVLIFGASSSVTRKITEIGAEHFMGGQNPISLCNVLFVGNLCSLIFFITIYWRQWNKAALKQLSRKDWFNLILLAILSGALAPSLFFQGLASTNVNNVVLLGRLQLPLTLTLSVLFLKERVTYWQVAGAITVFIGVILTVVLQSPGSAMMMGFHVGLGEFVTVAGAITSSASTILSKAHLSKIPVGIYSIVRTTLGTVIFFFAALYLFGSHHFMNAFSPFLWKWMFLYSAVIVVLGQLFWLKGFRASTVFVSSLVGSFASVAGIVAAYLILGEAPTFAQYVGGSIILIGIFLGQVRGRLTSSNVAMTVESKIGFKGV